MIDCTHNDILRRVEKVEIDVAVLDSKSNRLHQDMKDITVDVKGIDVKMDTLTDRVAEATAVSKRNQTYLLALGTILGGVYTFMQIIERTH